MPTWTGVTYFELELDFFFNTPGFYRLNVTRSQGFLCEDTFEDDNGRNDIPEDATVLFSSLEDVVPSACTDVEDAGAHTISCNSVLLLCDGESDFYGLRPPDSSQFTITVDGFGATADLDTYLYGPFETPEDFIATPEVRVDSSTNFSTVETLEFPSARPGAYFLVEVRRILGTATAYNLTINTEPAGFICVEDAFDQIDTAGTGSGTLVVDPIGLNDQIANATAVALQVDTPVEIRSDAATPVNLCAFDVDWFQLGFDDGGFTNVPPGHQIAVTLVPQVGSAGKFTVGRWQRRRCDGSRFRGPQPARTRINDPRDPGWGKLLPQSAGSQHQQRVGGVHPRGHPDKPPALQR